MSRTPGLWLPEGPPREGRVVAVKDGTRTLVAQVHGRTPEEVGANTSAIAAIKEVCGAAKHLLGSIQILEESGFDLSILRVELEKLHRALDLSWDCSLSFDPKLPYQEAIERAQRDSLQDDPDPGRSAVVAGGSRQPSAAVDDRRGDGSGRRHARVPRRGRPAGTVPDHGDAAGVVGAGREVVGDREPDADPRPAWCPPVSDEGSRSEGFDEFGGAK